MKALEVRIHYFMTRYPWVGPAIAAILVVLVSLYAIGAYKNARLSQEEASANLGEAILMGAVPPPEYTKELAEKISISTGLAALVLYTDRGFEPSEVRISAGEAVRFTNSSSGGLWVAAAEGTTVYPRTHESCGSSDLDSCEPLSPMDFWEFIFQERGEWVVTNNLDKSKTVRVVVE